MAYNLLNATTLPKGCINVQKTKNWRSSQELILNRSNREEMTCHDAQICVISLHILKYCFHCYENTFCKLVNALVTKAKQSEEKQKGFCSFRSQGPILRLLNLQLRLER
jgi:hypothetical protein